MAISSLLPFDLLLLTSASPCAIIAPKAGNESYVRDVNTNRYYSVAGANLSYDAAGNLTTDANGYNYQYDYENHIVKITKDPNDTVVAEFTYDALGRRIRKTDSQDPNNTRLYYYNNNWQVLYEYTDSNTLYSAFMYGNYIDEAVFAIIGSTYAHYAHDHLYSPAALIDQSDGAVLERYEYDAYGEPNILDSDFSKDADGLSDYDNNYLFTGRRLDILENGSLKIQYNRNRYYDYHIGRFTTHDPIGYADGLNLYEYAKSNPSMFGDPLGLGTYRIGSNLPSPPPHDIGAGVHGAEAPPTRKDRLSRIQWKTIAVAATPFVPDAARHMKHYLGNSGTTLTVRISKMVKESKNAQGHFYGELNDAMAFIEANVCTRGVPIVGTWTGGSTSDSKNWFFAVGGYSAAGSGSASHLGACKYKLAFTFHFDDRYNWDTGKGVSIFGIWVPDVSLGRLHRVGIAQEFDMVGETFKTIAWEKGQRFDQSGNLTPSPKSRR